MQKINNLTVDIQTPPRLTFRGGRKGTSRVKVRVHLPDKGAVIYCVLCELVLWAVRRLAKCVHWLVASWEDRRLLRLHHLPRVAHIASLDCQSAVGKALLWQIFVIQLSGPISCQLFFQLWYSTCARPNIRCNLNQFSIWKHLLSGHFHTINR